MIGACRPLVRGTCGNVLHQPVFFDQDKFSTPSASKEVTT